MFVRPKYFTIQNFIKKYENKNKIERKVKQVRVFHGFDIFLK